MDPSSLRIGGQVPRQARSCHLVAPGRACICHQKPRAISAGQLCATARRGPGHTQGSGLGCSTRGRQLLGWHWEALHRRGAHPLGPSPVLVIAKNRPQLGPPHLVFAEDLPCQVVEGMHKFLSSVSALTMDIYGAPTVCRDQGCSDEQDMPCLLL